MKTSLLFASLLFGFVYLVRGQCGDETVTQRDYCDGLQGEVRISDADPDVNFRWYQDDGAGGFSDAGYGQDGTGRYFLSQVLTSPTMEYGYRREFGETIGPNVIGIGSAQERQYTDADYEMEFDANTDFWLDSVSVYVTTYGGATNIMGLQVRIVPEADKGNASAGDFSEWHKFEQLSSAGLVTLPVGLYVTQGTNYVIQIRSETDAGEGIRVIDRFWYFPNNTSTFPNSQTYLTSPNEITVRPSEQSTNGGNSDEYPMIFDWKITVNCDLEMVNIEENTTTCCTPVGSSFDLDGEVLVTESGDFPQDLTVSGTDVNFSNPYFQWLDGSLNEISGASGTNNNQLTINQAGVYTVRVVRDAADLNSVPCYAEKTIFIQERQLFAQDDETICFGEQTTLTATGGTGNYVWSGLDAKSTALLNTTTGESTTILPEDTGTYTFIIQADVPVGNAVVDGDFTNFDPNALTFATQYSYQTGNIQSAGQYKVSDQIDAYGTAPDGFCNGTTYPRLNSGPGSGENFFYADALFGNSGSNKLASGDFALQNFAWQQTNRPVQQNVDYTFSVDVTEWLGGSMDIMLLVNGDSLPLSLEGVPLGSSQYNYSGDVHRCEWRTLTGTWNSGNNTTVDLTIAEVGQSDGNGEHEFGIDRISFGADGFQTDTVVVRVDLCQTLSVADLGCTSGSRQAEATYDGIFTGWYDDNDVLVSTDPILNVSPSGSETYTAIVSAPFGILNANTDFSQGSVGHNPSGSEIFAPSADLYNGQYSYVSNSGDFNGSRIATVPSQDGGPFFAMIPGSGTNQTLFRADPLSLTAGFYAIQFDMAYLSNTIGSLTPLYPLEVWVDGVSIASFTPDVNNDWQTFSFSWQETTANPSADVRIILTDRDGNHQTHGFGFDNVFITGAREILSEDIVLESCCTAPTDVASLDEVASDYEVCEGNTATLVANAITAGLDYIWQVDLGDGNGFVDIGTVADAPAGAIQLPAITDSGDYRLKIAADGNIDKSCVKYSDTLRVIFYKNPDVTATDPSAVCDDQTVDITSAWSDAEGTGGTITYYEGIDNTGDAVTAIDAASIDQAGDYYVQVDNNGCLGGDVISVTIHTTPVLSSTNPAAVCDDETVDITDGDWVDDSTTSGTVTYYIATLGGTQVADPSAIEDDELYIVEVDNNSCTDTAHIQVTINVTPDVQLTQPSAVCDDATIDITDAWDDDRTTNGTVTYFEGTDNSGTVIPAVDAEDISVGGDYYIQVDNNGCIDGDVLTLSFVTSPVLSSSNPASVCDDQTIDITDGDWVDDSTTGGTITYYEDNLGGTVVSDPSAIEDGGLYIVEVDNNSCTDTAHIQVTIYTTPDVSITAPDAICDNVSVNLTGVWEDGEETLGDVTYYLGTDNSGTVVSALDAASISTAGDYFIQVDNEGCLDGAVVNVQVNTSPSLTSSNPAAVCEGETIDITDGDWNDAANTGGTITYFEQALGGAIVSDPSAIADGGLVIVQVDNGGCTDTAHLQLTVHYLPEITGITGGEEICDDGAETATIRITFSGTPNYELVFTGLTSDDSTKTGITDDFYEFETTLDETYSVVSLMDGNGCEATELGGNTSVIYTPEVTATLDGTDCPFGTSTPFVYDVSVSAFGGTGDYVVALFESGTTTPVTGPSISGLASGAISIEGISEEDTVDIVVTDANGCNPYVISEVGRICSCPEKVNLAVASAGTDSVCVAGSPTTTTLEISFDDGGNSVSEWNFTLEYADGTILEDYSSTGHTSSNVILVSDVEVGSYYIRNVNGSCAGSGDGPIVIANYESPVASISTSDTEICDEGEGEATVSITLSGGEGSYDFTYEGTVSNDFTDSHSGSAPFTFTTAEAETWSVTSVLDGNGCEALPGDLGDDVTIAFFDEVTSTTPVPTCDDANNDVDLDIFNFSISLEVTPGSGEPDVIAGSGVTFENTVGNTWVSTLVDEDSVVTVQVLDDNGCDTVTFVVTQRCSCPTSAVLSLADESICADETTSLSLATTGGIGPYNITLAGPSGVEFSRNDLSAPFLPVAVSDSGDYTITQFFDVGADCDANVTNTALLVYPLPTATLVPPANASICDGEATDPYGISLEGTPTFVVDYVFDGTPGQVNASSQSTQIPGFSAEGDLQLTGVSDDHCTGVVDATVYPITVQTRPEATLDLVGGDICAGETAPLVEVNVVSGTGPYSVTYLLNGASETLSMQTGPGIALPASSVVGDYDYSILAFSDVNCALLDPATLGSESYSVNPLPTAVITGGETICDDGVDNVSLQIVFGGTPPYSFDYSEGGAPVVPMTASTNAMALDPTMAEGVHEVSNIVDLNGCVAENNTDTEVILSEPKSPQIAEMDTSFCAGTSTYELTAINTEGAAVTWYQDGELREDSVDAVMLTEGSDAGVFFIEVDDGICPPSSTQSLRVTIAVDDPITFVDIESEETVFVGESAAITGATDPEDVDSVRWSGVDFLSSYIEKNTTAQPFDASQEGAYTLVLEAFRGTCTNMTSSVLLVRVPLEIPNAFTPNGDNMNDVWNIQGLSTYGDANVVIYNRWGQVVYESESGYQDPWDGRRKGKNMPAATYYYVIDLGVEDTNGQLHKGNVTIVR